MPYEYNTPEYGLPSKQISGILTTLLWINCSYIVMDKLFVEVEVVMHCILKKILKIAFLPPFNN